MVRATRRPKPPRPKFVTTQCAEAERHQASATFCAPPLLPSIIMLLPVNLVMQAPLLANIMPLACNLVATVPHGCPDLVTTESVQTGTQPQFGLQSRTGEPPKLPT